MTKTEFQGDYVRLCAAWKLDPLPERASEWYQRIGHLPVAVWTDAVGRLIADYGYAPRAGMLDVLLQTVDRTQAERRQQALAEDRDQARQWMTGRVRWQASSPEEQAYVEFRSYLLRNSLQRGFPELARLHVEGLSAWLADPGHLRWAQATAQGDCRRHGHSHTVAQCLRDEIGYWTLRADGATEGEAYRKLALEVQR